VVRSERLELPAFWFVGIHYKTLSAASGVAYRGTRHLSRSWVGPKLDWNERFEAPNKSCLGSEAQDGQAVIRGLLL